ncbi:MAG: transcription elongation factor GreA [Desulfobacterales bacterium]|nr:MAG: transcription elongation factor GreA [Desulfobacterales bacterium]
MERIPMTPAGHGALKEEVRRLKEVERQEVIRAIQDARAHGDITENAEFEAAKERQAFIEGKIKDLEYKIACADVIDPRTVKTDRVMFGCTVVLENLTTEQAVRYQLVGPDESDVSQGRISVSSPLGKAMIGKEVGDEIVVQAPSGQRRYELVEILAS